MLKHYFDIILNLLRIFQKIISGKRGIIRYFGKDADYLNIKAICGSVTNTVQIQDLFYYDSCKTNKGNWNILPQATATFSEEKGMVCYGNAKTDGDTYLNLNYPNNFSVECEITDIDYNTGGYSAGLSVYHVDILTVQSPLAIWAATRLPPAQPVKFNGQKENIGDIIKFIKQGESVSIYRNGTLLTTANGQENFTGFSIRTYLNWKIGIKNLKIHEL